MDILIEHIYDGVALHRVLSVVVEGDVSFDMGNYRRMILRFCIRL